MIDQSVLSEVAGCHLRRASTVFAADFARALEAVEEVHLRAMKAHSSR